MRPETPPGAEPIYADPYTRIEWLHGVLVEGLARLAVVERQVMGDEPDQINPQFDWVRRGFAGQPEPRLSDLRKV